jgi:hypothetical protein
MTIRTRIPRRMPGVASSSRPRGRPRVPEDHRLLPATCALKRGEYDAVYAIAQRHGASVSATLRSLVKRARPPRGRE